jgi:metal-responsive CopG/Arc/MetJ family transcriptional regulator
MYMQTQTFNISMPKELVSMMDLVGRREFKNRSELIKEAVRVYLEERRVWDELFMVGRKQAKKIGIISEGDVNAMVRSYRKGR